MKQTYQVPELIVHGTVENLTQGPGWGLLDAWFGIGDGDGGWIPPYNDCDGFEKAKFCSAGS